MGVETSITETLYRISEEEGKSYWNGHEADLGVVRGNVMILNPENPCDGFHMLYNTDLFKYGQIMKDLAKDYPEYFAVFRIDDLSIWSVRNPDTHILAAYEIEHKGEKTKFSTCLYDGMYEENNDIFVRMYKCIGTRGHYTPSSMRNEMFKFIENLYRYAEFVQPHDPIASDQYVNIPARSQDTQIGIIDTVEFGLQFKLLARIALSKDTREK